MSYENEPLMAIVEPVKIYTWLFLDVQYTTVELVSANLKKKKITFSYIKMVLQDHLL